MLKLSIAEAKQKAEAMLVANDTAPENAASVANALVLAEADGLAGHGLMRLPFYAAQAKCGKIDGQARPAVKQRTGSGVSLDAANGFAYPAIDMAIDELLALTFRQGVAAASITRSSHCGAMGLVVERLASHGLVALMFANTPAAMAVWGGRRPLLGTNPIACAFPRPRGAPVVIDLSLSKVARGQIVAAKQKGTKIPKDWALDAQGQETEDPAAALAGSMLPLGGAKGAALALMVEALAAGLTGSHYAYEASSFLDAQGPPPGTGQLLIALNPISFGGNISHMERLFAEALTDGVRLPGARRSENRRRAEAEGLVVQEGWFAA
ncbi:Ldh family oxidoreductase [Acidocella facilis]|uniref:Ldh family oxidoreductase n=1 Tax=Acidocella facilis TaxID=525 RepID=UPI001F388C9E|nr:Ldh family oxidoreductase [Acidocella facilis]